MKRWQIVLAGQPFEVEIADTSRKKAVGLMYRKELSPHHGMLFYMNGGSASFHMKNTHIPLDVLFFNKINKVIKIAQMMPHTGKSKCSNHVHHVLELPHGTCKKLDIQVGDVMSIFNSEAYKVESLLRNIVAESIIELQECSRSVKDNEPVILF